MKKLKFYLFVLTISCISFIACKEKVNKNEKKYTFQESTLKQVVEDSFKVQSQFVLELNVGDESDRGAWQNPDLVIKKLGELTGKSVADIGSGTGYFTFPISRSAQKVLAIDIEQRYLDFIEDRKLELPKEQADVIETRLTVEDEPNLHADEVDAILMVNVFYYLNDREKYMNIVNNALRVGGVLVLVDFKPGDLPVGPSDNKVPSNDVVEILKLSGFDRIDVDEESLQYQYIITAK